MLRRVATFALLALAAALAGAAPAAGPSYAGPTIDAGGLRMPGRASRRNVQLATAGGFSRASGRV
jgi:hypothetical protein